MHVISIVSTKGGTGKTTLASVLAVRAASESKRVAIVDLDPQSSLAGWWERRGESDNPDLLRGADTATDAIEALHQTGWDWAFLDTPPAFVATIQDAIENAHLVLIPLKASAPDLIASEDAVAMAREAGIPFLCIINDAEPRWKTTSAARDYLQSAGVPVAEAIVCHRSAYLAALTSGKSGPEIDRSGAARGEIETLWREIKGLLAKAKRRTSKRETTKGGAS